MSSKDRGTYSALQKIKVTCNTCGISESYYSNLSVEHFKLNHRGHDVVGEDKPGVSQVRAPELRPQPRPEIKPIPESDPIFASISEPQAEPSPVDEVKLEPMGGVEVSKVIVDLLVFPALSRPVLRVRGFKGDEEAFVITVSPEGHGKVKDILAARKYDAMDGLPFVWDSNVVEYSEDARRSLGIQGVVEDESVAPIRIESGPVGSADVDDSVAAITEELFQSERRGRPPVEPEPSPIESSFPLLRDEPEDEEFEEDQEETAQAVAQEEPLAEPIAPIPTVPSVSPAPPVVEASPPTPPQVPRPSLSGKAGVVVRKLPVRERDQEDEEPLLVSKSWYIQGGNQNRKGAKGISNVLKEFRWKVEPEYTIGVMLDDILSVESAKNQISRRLIRRVEGAGYKLTAVVVDQGRPVAWFKKAPPSVKKPEGSDQPKEAVQRRPEEDVSPSDASAQSGENPPIAEELEIEPDSEDGPFGSVAP